MKRFWLAALVLALCLPLCGCTNTGLQATDVEPSVTLPPAEVSYVAPIGDAALEYTETALLYLPSHDGMGLTTLEAEITFSSVRTRAESLVRALLAQPSGTASAALGGSVRLSLYGTTPVEVSRDVVTVNLSASALQLDREKLYIACQAIANTLTELEEIRYVNVLVVDKPIGVDVANTLPMGSFQHSSASDLGAVYRQTLSRRVGSSESADNKPFSAVVTLYFPLRNTEGMVCEARAMSFENQRVADMVTDILRQLSAGSMDAAVDSPALPLLVELLTATPSVTETADGETVLQLAFAYNLQDMLDAYGISMEQCTASLCATLTTFLPQISGVQITVGGVAADPLLLTDDESAETDAELLRRAEVSAKLLDYCTLYFPTQTEGKLVSVLRPVAYGQTTHPRTLLHELSRGPQPCDSRQDVQGVLNGEWTDTAMLGFALSEQTLLVNFAPAFSSALDGMDAHQERALAYAMVNTLCADAHVKNVCFFQSGSQFEGFSGEIYWAGLFYPLPE